MTRSQIEKIKRAYERCEAERAEAKAQLTAFIRDWCAEKHGNLKRLAEAASIKPQALHGYLSGKSRPAGIVKLIELAEKISTL